MLWKNQSVGIEIENIKRPCFIDADTEQRRLEIDERVYTASEQGKKIRGGHCRFRTAPAYYLYISV